MVANEYKRLLKVTDFEILFVSLDKRKTEKKMVEKIGFIFLFYGIFFTNNNQKIFYFVHCLGNFALEKRKPFFLLILLSGCCNFLQSLKWVLLFHVKKKQSKQNALVFSMYIFCCPG